MVVRARNLPLLFDDYPERLSNLEVEACRYVADGAPRHLLAAQYPSGEAAQQPVTGERTPGVGCEACDQETRAWSSTFVSVTYARSSCARHAIWPAMCRRVLALLAFSFAIGMMVPQFGQGEAATRYPKPLTAKARVDSMTVRRCCAAWRAGVIVRTTFFGCQFPVAYLLAHDGRYDPVRRYRRVLVLRWPGVYAHVRRQGWLNAMEPVSMVTWWTPPKSIA